MLRFLISASPLRRVRFLDRMFIDRIARVSHKNNAMNFAGYESFPALGRPHA